MQPLSKLICPQVNVLLGVQKVQAKIFGMHNPQNLFPTSSLKTVLKNMSTTAQNYQKTEKRHHYSCQATLNNLLSFCICAVTQPAMTWSNTIFFSAKLCCRQCPGSEWGLCSKAGCGLPTLTCVAEAGRCGMKQIGNCRKRNTDLTAAEWYPGELGCAFTGKPMKWWASHVNTVFPGGHSLCVPYFLWDQPEAPGAWFAEGLMPRAMGSQSEMYTGYTTKAQHPGNSGWGVFKLGTKIPWILLK